MDYGLFSLERNLNHEIQMYLTFLQFYYLKHDHVTLWHFPCLQFAISNFPGIGWCNKSSAWAIITHTFKYSSSGSVFRIVRTSPFITFQGYNMSLHMSIFLLFSLKDVSVVLSRPFDSFAIQFISTRTCVECPELVGH